MSSPLPITVAYGDGIGPYIMETVLDILHAAGANIKVEEIKVGESVYLQGHSSGISDESWATILKNRVFLKSPITTPQGSGYKSLNVTIRKTLGLYANVRPCRAYSPFINTPFPDLNLTIIRENEEDLYAGVEYKITPSVTNSLKILTQAGTEKIIRYAFDYAVKNGRKKVTCMTKDNIMKMADGMFHKTFNAIAKEYPQIETDHYIIDIGSAKLASSPQIFDVIVTLNLYGDIISDIVAEVSGSVGLAGSGNIGSQYAMFEAIHGSAPSMEHKDMANPSGLLSGAIMMLSHIGQGSVATKIQNAFLKTIEDGFATKDFYQDRSSTKLLNTKDFGKAIIDNLKHKPKQFISEIFADFPFSNTISSENTNVTNNVVQSQSLHGCDFYIVCNQISHKFYEEISKISHNNIKFQMMSFRGMFYDDKTSSVKNQIVDYWRCRFLSNSSVTQNEIFELAQKITNQGFGIASTFSLYNYGDEKGYTLAQGE